MNILPFLDQTTAIRFAAVVRHLHTSRGFESLVKREKPESCYHQTKAVLQTNVKQWHYMHVFNSYFSLEKSNTFAFGAAVSHPGAWTGVHVRTLSAALHLDMNSRTVAAHACKTVFPSLLSVLRLYLVRVDALILASPDIPKPKATDVQEVATRLHSHHRRGGKKFIACWQDMFETLRDPLRQPMSIVRLNSSSISNRNPWKPQIPSRSSFRFHLPKDMIMCPLIGTWPLSKHSIRWRNVVRKQSWIHGTNPHRSTTVSHVAT